PELLAGDASKFEILHNSIDHQKGLIFLDMKTIEGPSTLEGPVASLTLVPLRETSAHVAFQFVHPFERDPVKEPFTRLMLADRDQLGTRFSQADGVVHLDLPIYETLDKAKRKPQILKAGEPSEEGEDGAPIQLSLSPRRSEVNVGEIIHVDVVISNPDRKLFDAVNLLIAFNNRVFEPVDADEGAPGINIADEKYFDEFPLDFPVVNIVDQEKGIIDYRKKAMRKPCRSEGVLATIQLRAVHPTKKTTFRLFLSETRQEPTTGLSFRYKDLLGDPRDPFDGVETCSLGVRPTTAYLDKLDR
ncbi:MAG: cohesin domain-containing protein, partial [Candidatus Hinthialibacter sp.]